MIITLAHTIRLDPTKAQQTFFKKACGCARVAKLHYEISCIRKDGLDKLTTYLCQNYKIICIEDLNVNKTCSGCNWVKEGLTLSNREFICENCGQVIDRDLNAAINIENFGLNKIGMVNPKLTPVDKEALACSDTSETALDEAGISAYTEMYM